MKIYVPTKIATEAEAEALPHGTKVFHDDMSVRTPVPYLYVKRGDGSFVDWQGHILYLDEIVPCTALAEHEVHERKVRAQGEIGPGVGGGGKMLYTDFGRRQPLHERMVWNTEWRKVEDQG